MPLECLDFAYPNSFSAGSTQNQRLFHADVASKLLLRLSFIKYPEIVGGTGTAALGRVGVFFPWLRVLLGLLPASWMLALGGNVLVAAILNFIL